MTYNVSLLTIRQKKVHVRLCHMSSRSSCEVIWTRLTNPMDAESLQKDLDSLSTWSARWQQKFNPEKCKLMHIGHKQDTKYTIHQDNINWNIQEVTEEKDLEVLTTCTLKVARQCQEEVLNANWVWSTDSSEILTGRASQ